MSNKALLSTKRITTFIQLLILLLALMTMMNGLVSSCTHRVDVTIIRDHFWDGVSNKSKTISCKICATLFRIYGSQIKPILLILQKNWWCQPTGARRWIFSATKKEASGFYNDFTTSLINMYNKKFKKNVIALWMHSFAINK